MDNPIADQRMREIVYNEVDRTLECIGRTLQVESDIHKLELELEQRKRDLTSEARQDIDQFDAFMELLELSSIHDKMTEAMMSFPSFCGKLRVDLNVNDQERKKAINTMYQRVKERLFI